jgi:cysteine synthase
MSNFQEFTSRLNPIVICEHSGFYVVRDDLLGYGSKSRFAERMIAENPHKEYVYGGAPAQGWAPISLAYLAKLYSSKVTVFIPARAETNLTLEQKLAKELGCNFVMIKTYGSMKPCIDRARQYASESANRVFLPLGLDCEEVLQGIHDVCQTQVIPQLPALPARVFSVAGSGTLSRGLQRAFPKSAVHAVQTGMKLRPENSGRATVHVSKYSFKQKVKGADIPPYPSLLGYDAKVWEYVLKYGQPGDLVWNVAGELQ